MRIILVEDNEALNTLVTFRLKKAGHEVYGCTFAAELIQSYREIDPDLLLLDYTLPDMNGKELVETLQEMNMKAPFIIVTGHSDIQLAIDLMKMGALDFVVKDDNFQDVLPAVVSRVNHRIQMEKQVKKFQQQLVKSEALYRNTVNQIPDPILYYYENHILFINQAFKNKLGYTLRNLKTDYYRRVLPEQFFRKVNLWAKDAEENTVYPVFEMSLKSRNGDNLNVLVKAIKSEFEEKPAIMIVYSDITEKRQFENRLMKSIIDTQEQERIRFARDLHDELGPILSGLKLYVDLLAGKKAEEEQSELKLKIQELIDSAVQTSRNLSSNVIPGVLMDFGLNKAIQAFVDQLSSGEGPEINFASTLDKRLEQNLEISIYRVVKEMINNSLKHAEASVIDIQIFLSKSGALRLFYEDDGKGFDFESVINDMANSGIGLRNIINRLDMVQAKYHFETAPGEGFALSMTINL